MSSLRVYGKNVLVQIVPPPTQHSDLIIIPQQYIKHSNQGIVKMIGQDVQYVQIGMYVVFEELKGTRLDDKNGSYMLLDEDEIDAEIRMEPETIEGLFHETGDGYPVEYFRATHDSAFRCIIEHYANKPSPIQSFKKLSQ
jgi:co-chaperonin GroES (HSP10)